MMEAVHATEEWQRAGVHYIRIQAMCVGFDIPLKYEFADDTKDSEYILVHENGFPVSTCRYGSMKKMPVISSVLPHWKSTGENITGHLESRQRSSF